MNMNNKNWVSVWGNAVSIAEHHPEAYAKYITLRYPVYIPFDGDTLRFTFDNYCEAVTVTRATVSAATSPVYEKMPLACPCKKETICDITFSKNESVTMEAHQTAVSDPVSFPVKKGMTLTVSLYFADFTLMQSAVLVTLQRIFLPRRPDTRRCPSNGHDQDHKLVLFFKQYRTDDR